MLTIDINNVVETKVLYKFNLIGTRDEIRPTTISIRKKQFEEKITPEQRMHFKALLRTNAYPQTCSRGMLDRLVRELIKAVKIHKEKKDQKHPIDSYATKLKNPDISTKELGDTLLQAFTSLTSSLPTDNTTKTHSVQHSKNVLRYAVDILDDLAKTHCDLARGTKYRKYVETYVTILAIFHDLWDTKFSKYENITTIQNNVLQLCSTLIVIREAHNLFYQYNHQYSYKNLVGRAIKLDIVSYAENKKVRELVLCVVADADKLDACGALGYHRACVYAKEDEHSDLVTLSDTLDTFLFDPYQSFEEYVSDKNPSALRHIGKKLIHLHNYMFTEYGRKLGQEKCKLLELFAIDLIESLKH